MASIPATRQALKQTLINIGCAEISDGEEGVLQINNAVRTPSEAGEIMPGAVAQAWEGNNSSAVGVGGAGLEF